MDRSRCSRRSSVCRFVDLAIEDSDVRFNVFNTAQLHFEHEPMVHFNVAHDQPYRDGRPLTDLVGTYGQNDCGLFMLLKLSRTLQRRRPARLGIQYFANRNFSCAVKRRWSTVGESPTRELVRSAR